MKDALENVEDLYRRSVENFRPQVNAIRVSIYKTMIQLSGGNGDDDGFSKLPENEKRNRRKLLRIVDTALDALDDPDADIDQNTRDFVKNLNNLKEQLNKATSLD